MTKAEIEMLNVEEIEARSAALADEAGTADEMKLDEINAELDFLEERKAQLLAEAEQRKADAAAVAAGAGEIIEEAKENKMTDKEIRSSKKYIDAYVDYIKGKNDGTECRALLTENADTTGLTNVSGPVPVPTYIEDRIQVAWENDQIMSRVSKTYLKGILKVGVEMSATPAGVHAEGDEAPDEEQLILAVVQLVPETIKKWITVSTEVMDLNGEAFLDYLYDEIEYQIVKAAAGIALGKIDAAGTSGTSAPIVAEATITAPALSDIVSGIGSLSGDARDIVFIANRGTIAAYQALGMGANYAVDVFGGATVIPTDLVPSFANASEDDVFAYVGDLSAIRANYPNGDEVKFVFDEYSLAEQDLVKIVGRQMAGIGLIRSGAFTRFVKGEE